MQRLFSSLCLSLSLLLACVSPGLAAKKAHGATHAPKKQASQKAHLARLAAKEKAAWHEHLAKLRDLPKKKRIAMKRHDKRFKKQTIVEHQHALRVQAHEAKVQAHLAKARAHLAKARAAKQAAQRTHEARLAARPHRHLVKQAVKIAHAHPAPIIIRKVRPVEKRLAHIGKIAPPKITFVHKPAPALSAHNIRLAAHNARLARQQAAHQDNMRAYQNRLTLKQQAHNERLAQKLAAHNARLANLQAIRNAHLAAQNAHHVALNGDGSGGKSIRFWQTVAAHVPVKVIAVDLNDNNVKVSAVMSRKGSGTAEPFRQMIQRANPNVAVTGTFFSLDNLQPIGDIVIDGSLIHFGGMGTALCITPDNRAKMVTCEWGRHHDWSPYDFVCACGPRLLERGRIVLDPHAERFRDKHMLSPNSRIAVGITRGNTLVFVMTHKPIFLGRLAQVMQSLGASEAMNLDAGTSTGFYYNGATLAHPGRQLTNMIVVYGRRSRYQQALAQLVPAAYHRADPHFTPHTPRGRVLQVLDPLNGNYQLQPIRH